MADCEQCEGTGELMVPDEETPNTWNLIECHHCGGTGSAPAETHGIMDDTRTTPKGETHGTGQVTEGP